MKTSLRTNVIAVTRVHCIICKLHEGTAKPEEATLFTWSIMAILIAKGIKHCYCLSDLAHFQTRLRFYPSY